MSSKFIFSTLTNDQVYATWKQADGTRLPVRDQQVKINGGTGVASKHFVTPRGVVTEVTAEQLAILEKVPAFQRHKERGFLSIEDKRHDVEKVAADLKPNDDSAPLTPEDFADGKAPKVGNATDDEDDAPAAPAGSRRRRG